MAKAIMFCISVLVQLLEWNCLIFMMRFQADKKSKNRVQITIDQYQTRERFWLAIYFLWALMVSVGLFATSFVTGVKHHEDPTNFTDSDRDQLMRCVQATLYLILIVHTLVTGISLLWHMKTKQYIYFTEQW